MADTGNTQPNTPEKPEVPPGLVPWRAGVSGNPSGRPKTVLARAYREKLREIDLNDPKKRTYGEVIAARVVEAAAHGKGNAWMLAAKEVADRSEGKPAQRLEVDEKPPARLVKPDALNPVEWASRFEGAVGQDEDESN